MLILTFLVTDVAAQDKSKVKVLRGEYQLSGGSAGCVAMDHHQMVISYGGTFASQPKVSVHGSVAAPQDSVEANVDGASEDSATVSITTHGRNGNQVCAPTYLHWQASL
jgi:hypothetical protein